MIKDNIPCRGECAFGFVSVPFLGKGTKKKKVLMYFLLERYKMIEQLRNLESAWFATKICHAKNLARNSWVKKSLPSIWQAKCERL